MKKFIFILSLFAIMASVSFAEGTWIQINSAPAKPRVILDNSNISTSVFEVKLGGFWKKTVETSQGEAWLIDLGNNVRNLEKGAPDLPYISTSLIIPDMSNMEVEIVSSEFKEFKNVLVAPSKGNLYRDIDPETVPYVFGKVYQRNAFYPNEIVTLNKPYIVRDFRGQAVWIKPFSYNPVTKVLRVYYNIKVKVYENGKSTVNVLNRNKPLTKIDDQFKQIYSRHFLNFNSAESRYNPVDEHGNMLIISYGDFMDAMQPFIEWKQSIGIPVEIVDVATIGNNSANIKQYVADYYNNNGLTFLVLVGDAQQVQPGYASGDSDNDYTYVVGNDHYPDLFCGRFSAENVGQVETQVQRVIDYEKNPSLADTAWFTKALAIGSDQGPGDDDEYDYQHERNILENKLLPFTYNYGYELYDGSQGGNDEPGNPNPGDVANVLNSGVTIINYTGHGSTTSWGTTSFSNSDITNLENAGKLPFIISVACVNGNFVGGTCFAEKWLRSKDSEGNPIGAIATLMSTINQSWNPPMEGQDAINDILVETFPDNIKRTFGGITMNGCMEMNDVYGDQGVEMTDTWTIFGDPSVMVRTAVPQELTADYPSVVIIGESQITVSCPVDGAIVAISRDGELLKSAVVDNGEAVLDFDEPFVEPGILNLSIVAFNYLQYTDNIEVIAGDGPFVGYVDYTLNDEEGNNNGQADYNEQLKFSLRLTNLGTEGAQNVVATISSDDNFVSILDDTENYGNIAPGDTVSVADGFEIQVADSVPDLHPLSFNLTITSDTNVWTKTFKIIAHAPDLKFVEFSIDDSNGNNNGQLDPGETVNMTVKIDNEGSSDAYNVMAQLVSQSQWVSITQPDMNYGDLSVGDSATAVYEVTADGDTPLGYIAWFDLNISADYNVTGYGTFSTVVGQKAVLVLNLASQTVSADSMMAAFSVLSVSADISTTVPDDLYKYQCVFTLLGVYSDNYVLSPSDGQKLADYLDGGGNLYMEGGDTWYYDDETPVHPYFHINGTADGSSSFLKLIGDSTTFMKDFIFDYDGGNNWMDEIEPLDSAFTIFYNQSPDYNGPAVIAYDGGTYKTIGSVAEFGGLHPGGPDGTGGNQPGYMALMLYYFGVDFTWTGIENNFKEENNGLKVYPNPFKSIVNFEIEENLDDNAKLIIYDLQGKVLETSDINSKRFSWTPSRQNMKEGFYFYKLINGNKVSTGKLIFAK